MTPEGIIQSGILEYLRLSRIMAWRNNTGATKYRSNGRERFLRYGTPGSGDILGVLPDGRFFSIEVKQPGKYPSRKQKEFIAAVNKNNGVAFVARSIEDVENVLKKEGVWN